MYFNRAEFHESLVKNDDAIDQYLILCLRSSIEATEELKVWQQLLFRQIKYILVEPHLLPILKVFCAKFLIYLFLLGDTAILQNIQRNIYPIIKAIAVIDRELPLFQRGQNLFLFHSSIISDTANHITSSQLGKKVIRTLGIQYVRFFLETVPVWANWLPTDLETQTKPSIYFSGYQQLLQSGLQFPSQQEYVLYTKSNIEDRQNKIKILIDRMDLSASRTARTSSLISQRKRRSDSMLLKTISKLSFPKIPVTPASLVKQKIQIHTKTTSANPFEVVTMPNIAMMTGVSPFSRINPISSGITQNMISALSHQSSDKTSKLQPRIRQQVVQTHTVYSPLPFTQQITAQISERSLLQQKNQLQLNYQTRIHELSRMHKQQLSQVISNLKTKYSEQIEQSRIVYERLKQQNLMLRAEVSQMNSKLNQYSSMISSMSKEKQKISQQFHQLISSTRIQTSEREILEEIRRLKTQNYQLKNDLLDDCIEKQEFRIEQYKEQKDRFVVFDSNERFLVPSLKNLTPDDRIRFKKCLLKSKGVLYKNRDIEVGCVTCFKELNVIKIKICVTNISASQINLFSIQFNNSQDIQFIEKQSPTRTLPSKYQQQLSYICTIRHKDFRIPEFTINYVVEGVSYSFVILFPATKCKLIQPLSSPHLLWYNQQTLQKVIPLNPLMLQSISKLKQIYPSAQQRRQFLLIPITYLNDQYELQFKQIDQKNIKLRIFYQRGNEDNAYELLDEYVFILGCQ